LSSTPSGKTTSTNNVAIDKNYLYVRKYSRQCLRYNELLRNLKYEEESYTQESQWLNQRITNGF